jgi:chorismate-pyruvate lyase
MLPALQPTKQIPGWMALLERFYTRAGLTLPPLLQLKDDEVPQPYKSLLVHSLDMTPTLEGFYQQRLGLAVLSRERQDDSYYREVILNVDNGARPVGYGAIRVCLDHLPPAIRDRVLEEQRPFGNILQSESFPHMSWPQAFFRTEADAHMSAVLRLHRPCPLYGRRNVLLDSHRRLLAEVIEVLSPVPKTPNP